MATGLWITSAIAIAPLKSDAWWWLILWLLTLPLPSQELPPIPPELREQIIGDRPVHTENSPGRIERCIGQLRIFSGKASECRPSGPDTMFKNCCKNTRGEVTMQGQASLVTMGIGLSLAGKAVSTVGTAVKVGYTTYQSTAALGVSSQLAADMGMSAATSHLQGAIVGIDPTTLAISIGLMIAFEMLAQGCDPDDMTTALLRDNGFCIEVGEYEKTVSLVMTQKVKSYCCFNSKLARSIQQQGRKQLKTFNHDRPFGSAKHPDCRGMTPEDFEALDFSKIDLSEFTEEMLARARAQQEKLENKVQNQTGEFIQKRQ